MSTRGAWGFRIDETDKVTYNHQDSDAPYLGKSVFQFVRDNFKHLEAIAKRIELVSNDFPPTGEQYHEILKKFPGISNNNVADATVPWYRLLRNAQTDGIALYGEGEGKGLKHMIDNHNFLRESLYCEYAYIININTGMLEVYKGFQKTHPKGRYAGKKIEGYYGVGLFKEYALTDIAEMTDEDIIKLMGNLNDVMRK